MLARCSLPTVIRLCAWLWLAGSGTACEPVDDLAHGAVTSLPDGDGVGSAASGSYLIAARTDVCSGPCQYLSPLSGTGHYCEVGQYTVKAAVRQTDGHLEVEASYVNLGMRIALLSGGIDASGHFEIGGVREAPTATMRIKGAIGAGSLTATGTARLRRPDIGDCLGTYYWSGTRDGEPAPAQ